MAIRTSVRPILAMAAGLALGLTGVAHADDHAGHNHSGGSHAGHDHAKKDKAAQSMAMAEVGAPAPDFTLTSVDGKSVSLSEFTAAGKTVVLEWFNPDCPFVKKHHMKHDTMKTTHAKYPDVVWLAVNSGASGKQGHGKERNAEAVKDYGITYPVLLDEDGAVGRLYSAKTTPHMFVIHDGTLVYAGAIDDDRSPDKLGETNYVVAALDAVLAGGDVAVPETKSYGCSVNYAANPVP
jgi:peroxiredoxin